MKAYVVKVTYLEGIHEGKTYYLDRRGYVRENLVGIWKEDTYTLRGCKIACTRKTKENDFEVNFEMRDRSQKLAAGKNVSKYPIYILSKYEPFEVETVD